MFSRPTGVINMIHKMHLGQFAYASEEINGENFQDTTYKNTLIETIYSYICE